MRRLVVVSLLLVLGGMVLLFPSSALFNLLTTGDASGGAVALQRALSPDNTTTIESMIGFGLIGVGAVLEFFSLFTDVGVRPSGSVARSDRAGPDNGIATSIVTEVDRGT